MATGLSSPDKPPFDSRLDAEDGREPSLEIRGLLHVLWRRSWIIGLLALIGGVGAGAYVHRRPTFYEAVAVIEVESREQKPIAVKDDGANDLQNPDVVETIVEDFHHRSLMERVAQALDLMHDPQFLVALPAGAPTLESVTAQLLKDSGAQLQLRTRLINVTYVHRDPKVAQKIANALVDQFLQQGVEQRMKAVETQNTVLQKKSGELKEKLGRSEMALQDYKKRLETVSVEDQRNLVEEKLKSLNTELSGARSERAGLESDLHVVKAAGGQTSQLLLVASVAQDPEVVTAQQALTKSNEELAGLLQRYRDRWPGVIEQRAQVDHARQSLAQTVASAPARLDSRFRAAANREQNLQRAASDQEKALLELEDKVIPYRALQREYESDRSLFESVLQQLKASTLAMGVQSANFHVVEPAATAVPLANKKLLIILGATLGLAILAASVIGAQFFLDSSIHTTDGAENLLGIPVLAEVPMIKANAEGGTFLAVLRDAASPAAESFRTLRAAISLLGRSEDQRVILFTSALAGEGKSLTAMNMAAVLAQQGLRTVLVEADLRKPTVTGRLLKTKDKPPGLAELLVGKPADLQPTSVENLSLLPAGSAAPNPAELLAGDGFGKIIEGLKRNYDRIVIDSAPVNLVSDTLNIVRAASVVCLVVRSHATPRKAVRRAVEFLHRARVRPAGIVLNCLPRWSGVGYHYYYSGESKYGSQETYGGSYGKENPPAA